MVACTSPANMPSRVKLQCVYEGFHPSAPVVRWHSLVGAHIKPPRYSFLAWIACQNHLPAKDNVSRYGLVPDMCCCLCKEELETCEYLFFNCQFARMKKMGANTEVFSLRSGFKFLQVLVTKRIRFCNC